MSGRARPCPLVPARVPTDGTGNRVGVGHPATRVTGSGRDYARRHGTAGGEQAMTDNAAPPEKPQRGSKRAPGRYATGITPEQESAVIEAMATQHVTLDVACRLAGVTVSVAYAWQRWGEAP